MHNGENGRGVTFVGEEKKKVKELLKKHQINVLASDIIPLNRLLPDSRPPRCKYRTYAHDLPTTSIIIPFYDEWPSILIRTLYSIINRTPRHLLQEIILVDDNSQMVELKRPLDEYINDNFPKGIIKVIRNPTRLGLIKARLKGWRESTGQVVVFFDSHMEVNIDWLQPLLTEVKKDRKTIAMGVLDYVNAESFEYRFNEGYMTRYGFDWRLVFFETFFRQDQIGATEEDVRPGTIMVGAAYAVDSKYFGEIGAYDEGMTVWGGENLEMSWRARNLQNNQCLDNHSYLFQAPETLYVDICHYKLATQSGYLKHIKSGFCLDHDGQGPIMRACNKRERGLEDRSLKFI
ncbi:GALNT [Mytilus coruscus]|uniref:Polypeptide N-acetylgalactosaminyltransferase n=1 Tax=Mytilus coruscus TaxID=42192 RepID=A0A6J8BWU9_MYTCO|nr:GALNT [Mytilus coruscus]